MMLDQIAIAILGGLSVWLTNSPDFVARRWAAVAGIAAQPFWIHATFAAEQWGMFALSLVFVVGWGRGIYHHWIVGEKV